jgi:hypothetical protein
MLAQTIVKGKTIDSRTNKSLSFCTVYFKGKKIGTKSDGYGNFVLSSPKTEDSLYVSYIGYKTRGVKIEGNLDDLKIYMTESSVRAKKEAVIRGTKLEKDTLAVRIIKNVIKNKSRNRPSSFDYIQYKCYSKFEVDIANLDSLIGNGFILKPLKYILEYQSVTPDGERYSPLLFRETLSKDYMKGTKKKKQILAVKDTKLIPNESIYQVLSYTFDDYDIYQNAIIIANTSFTSPVADGALIFYRYYVEDSFFVEGKKNYQMAFAPVSKEDFGFTGKLLIEEGSWALKDVSLTIDKRANINFVNHLALSQQFKHVENKWFVVKDEKDIALTVNKNGKNNYKLRFRQTQSIDSINVKDEIPDEVFTFEEKDYMAGYKDQSEAYWAKNRIDTLNAYESGIYKRADTFKKTSQYQTIKYFTRVGTSAFFPIPPVNWEVGRAFQFVSWNEYEGMRYRFGMRTTWDFSKKFNVYPWIAYGSKDNQVKYGVDMFINLPTRNLRWNQLQITAMHDYSRFGPVDNYLYFDNIISSATRSTPIRDIMLRDEIKVNWTKEWSRGLQTTLGFGRSKYYRNDYFTLYQNDANGNLVSLPTLTTTKISMSLRYAPKEPIVSNDFVRTRYRSIYPIIYLSADVGLKGLWESNYDFMALKGSAEQTFPFFLGKFRYQISAGKIMGKVPYLEMNISPGNNGFIRDITRFYVMNEMEFISDQWAQLWVTHNFNGFFLNKIPLLKKLQLRESVFTRMITGSISDYNKNYIQIPNQLSAPLPVYAEAGFTINNIFKIGEINFAWRLTQLDRNTTRPFGILAGIKVEL